MSLNTNQRRDQRRRLVVSWKRSAGTALAAASESPRVMAAYEPEAHPEKQRGPATLLPTGIGGLSLAILAISLPLVAAIAAGASEHLFGRSLFSGGGRFARTLMAASAVFDPRTVSSLQGWLSHMYLITAAGVAVVVRLMRRHRRDDYKGRFRAWGWMAALFLIAACSSVVPVGRLFGRAMSDATGVTLGPDGIGWWISAATGAFFIVSLWAVLPLHERTATALWLSAALVAWAGAAATTWLAAGRERVVVAGLAAWSLGGALAMIAMLAAARSVIREVRGQCVRTAKPKSNPKGKPDNQEKSRHAPAVSRLDNDEDADGSTFDADDAAADESETVYVDGTEHEQRHLSKAERKRLRKLARMNGVAA